MKTSLELSWFIWCFVASMLVNNVWFVDGSPGTLGKEFVFNFPFPYTHYPPTVMISTASANPVSVNVSVPEIDFQQTTTTRDQHVEVELAASTYLDLTSDIQEKTVIVTADEDVSVYGMISWADQSDGFMVLPTFALGTNYVVLAYKPYRENLPSEFSILALEDNTDIQITLPNQNEISKTLDKHQTYLTYDGDNDITGSIISANKPIAVMSGVAFALPEEIPMNDGMMSMLPSEDNFGTNFIVAPVMGRTSGYLYRITTLTTAQISISNGDSFTLERGQMHEGDVTDDSILSITSDQPVMVMQYMKGHGDGNGDAAMALVPPVEMFADAVTFPVYRTRLYGDFRYYVTIITQCSNGQGLTYDDAVLAETLDTVTLNDMCAFRKEVTLGTHNVGHTDPSVRFSVTVYGYNYANSYAYPAGFNVNIISGTSGSDGNQGCTVCEDLELICVGTGMTATFGEGVLPYSDASDVHLIDESCMANINADNPLQATVSTDYHRCGTTMEEKEGHILFKNQLILGSGTAQIEPMTINIQCQVERTHQVDMDIISVSMNTKTSVGVFAFSMNMFIDDTFGTPFPDESPIEMKIGDLIYMGTSVDTVNGLDLLDKNCYATPTADPNDATQYSLINDGCASDSTVNLVDTAKFSFPAFQFKGETGNQVFVHCEMLVCDPSNQGSRCKQGCIGEQRKRRSIKDLHHVVSSRPFTVRG